VDILHYRLNADVSIFDRLEVPKVRRRWKQAKVSVYINLICELLRPCEIRTVEMLFLTLQGCKRELMLSAKFLYLIGREKVCLSVCCWQFCFRY